jgi:hypothetical protein
VIIIKTFVAIDGHYNKVLETVHLQLNFICSITVLPIFACGTLSVLEKKLSGFRAQQNVKPNVVQYVYVNHCLSLA